MVNKKFICLSTFLIVVTAIAFEVSDKREFARLCIVESGEEKEIVASNLNMNFIIDKGNYKLVTGEKQIIACTNVLTSKLDCDSLLNLKLDYINPRCK